MISEGQNHQAYVLIPKYPNQFREIPKKNKKV